MRDMSSVRALFASLIAVAAMVGLSGCSASTASNAASPAGSAATSAGSWKVHFEADAPTDANMVGFLDDTYGLGVGHTGVTNYTHDGGKSWTLLRTALRSRYGLDIVDQDLVWDCGTDNLGLSTDGGKTWQLAGLLVAPANQACLFVSFVDASIGWAATAADLNVTADGGQTWTDVTLPAGLNNGIAAIRLRTATDGCVLDNGGTVWSTADAGKTWTSQSLGLGSGGSLVSGGVAMAAIYCFDASRWIVVAKTSTSEGTAMVAMHTSDGGRTWGREKLSVDARFISSVYLARDGVTLTVSDGHKVTVFRYE